MIYSFVDFEPVPCDRTLGLRQSHCSRTNLTVYVIFDLVFLVRPRFRCIRLGPEVFRVGGTATYLQGNEVILLVVAEVRILISVFLDLPFLQRIGVTPGRPDSGCITTSAYRALDVLLRYCGVRRARSAPTIRKIIMSVTGTDLSWWQVADIHWELVCMLSQASGQYGHTEQNGASLSVHVFLLSGPKLGVCCLSKPLLNPSVM